MLNPTWHELVLIRVSVFLLTYAPFFYLLLPPSFSIPALLLELAYYLLLLRPFEVRLSGPAAHPPHTRAERERLFQRCIENIPDPERYLSLWTLGADSTDIHHDNVREFLLWAFFDRQHDDPSDTALQQELDSYMARTERLLDRPLAPGRGSAIPIRLTFDKVPTRFRSIIWYIIVGGVDAVTQVRLLWCRFRFYGNSRLASLVRVFPPRFLASFSPLSRSSPSSELTYWYRPATGTSTANSTLPVVFLHGIGIGLYPYVAFLSEIPTTSPVLAVEILPISMRLTRMDILTKEAFVRHLKQILRQHAIHRFVLIGHSYGTALTTRILHDSELGPQVEGVVLVDPVTLLLHLPDVAYNFTRRMPTSANEWQLWYMASMDPGIALVLGRHFFWRENGISKDELVTNGQRKRKAAVCLASRDLIVDTVSVARYFCGDATTELGIELLWFQMDHSQVFERCSDYRRILAVVRRFCESS
ncbi:hypothetical protein BD289DRAFT_366703 [Coniella lustricola]|uniref:AB hydrolase-1 domain-containing protein n=1 Tax=Coniella lustricola TaxID=2025994 RepID=A0A2T3AAN6_9PEZI|nr:hypothetical protein BD289DRAFT_366703 [Coniella lustricola]